MAKKCLLTVFFVFAACLSVFAEPIIELEGRYWAPDLTAKALATYNSLGTAINFRHDLGMENKSFPEALVTLHLPGSSKIRLSYTQIKYSGEKRVESSIIFNGKSYSVGTDVSSDLNVKYVKLGWAWQFIDLMGGMFKLGPVIDIKGFTAAADLGSSLLKENRDYDGVLPAPGLCLNFSPFEMLDVFAEISGLSAGDYGHFFDAEIGAKLFIFGNTGITAGYRAFDIKAQDDIDYAKVEISGFFAGIAGKF